MSGYYQESECFEIDDLLQTSGRLISLTQNSSAQATPLKDASIPLPSVRVLRQLNEKATSQLAEAVHQRTKAEHNSTEIAAIRDLLDKGTHDKVG